MSIWIVAGIVVAAIIYLIWDNNRPPPPQHPIPVKGALFIENFVVEC